MNTKTLLLTTYAAALLSISLAVPGFAAGENDKPSLPKLSLSADSTPINRSAADMVSYAAVVKRASASVVCVSATKPVQQRDVPQLFNDPFFHRFFNNPNNQGENPGQGQNPNDQEQNQPPGNGRGGHRRAPQEAEAVASGVIISSDGYIVTNNHVVDDATKVIVYIGEPRVEYKATVVGQDPDADLAVIKIDATGLVPATFGDSDQLEVGDTVLAIGNPFGVGLTVTHGIISAVGRSDSDLKAGKDAIALQDFIQTDAAINPGNSGGALVDSNGRLIGINAAIVSDSGGSSGVGFAIPVNMVRTSAAQLANNGKVARGYLGVSLQSLTPELAEAFKVKTGAIVSDVKPGTPAAKAGILHGDIITKVNGRPVSSARDLQKAITRIPPGADISVDFLRDSAAKTATVTLAVRPLEEDEEKADHPEKKDQGVLNGVSVDDLSPDAREQGHVPASVKGVIVTQVDPDSASAKAGIAPGDVIEELEHKPVSSADEAVKLSADIKGPKVLVRFWHRGASHYVVVDESQK